MKKIKLILFGLICLLGVPFTVDAASAKITVSAPSSVVVGNTITVTVKLSSSSSIGSWEMDLNYNSDYLKMTSAGGEGGGTSMVNSSSGTKSKTYTFKFKALKSGTTKISVPSYAVYAFTDFEEMSVTTVSDSVRIMTQSELEATYSSDAYLKSLTVGSYDLNPKFKKDVYEYSVEVENDVTSVKISASKNDSRSDVSGTGEFNLEEGNNVYEITVTAQKGNQLTYKVNVYRKELDPISVYIDDEDKTYTMVRKADLLPNYQTYSQIELNYEDYQVPALKSEITGYELVGLKDETGTVYMYIHENGKVLNRYIEVTDLMMNLYPQPLEVNDKFDIYTKTKEVINNKEIDGYKLNDNSDLFIFYARNILTGDYNYYVYDLENETLNVYNNEIEEYYKELIEKYKYVLLGVIGLVIILLFIIILRRPKKIIINAPTKEERKELKDLSKLIEEHIDSEIEEEIEKTKELEVVPEEEVEEKKEEPIKKNRKKNKNKNKEEVKEEKETEEELVKTKKIDLDKMDEIDINEVEEIEKTEEISQVKVTEIPAMSPRDQKKLLKQQKKLLKQQKKREKARREFDF